MIANSNVFDRFAILDSGTASIYDIATNKLETIIDNCNSFALTIKGDAIEITEKGEVKMNINKPLSGELKWTAETTSFAQLNLALNGAGFELNSAVDEYQKTQTFTVTDASSMVFNLSTATSDVAKTYVHLTTKEGELVKELAFTLDATKKIVTVTNDSDVAVGDTISIKYFATMPVGTVYSFKVPSKGSNGSKRVLIDVLAMSEVDESPRYLQFDIYKASITSGITVTCDSTKPSSFDISMKILSDSSKKIGTNEESGFFEVRTPLETDGSTISDLAVGTTTSTTANLTWTPDSDVTSVKLQYKLSTDSSYSYVLTSGTTGIYISSPLTSATTATTVNGLTSGSTYNFRLEYIVDSETLDSNVITVTP